jgi:predicted transcriptional regulator
MDSQLTLRLPGKLAGRLERSARRMKRKRSEVVRLALEQFLESGPAEREGPVAGVAERTRAQVEAWGKLAGRWRSRRSPKQEIAAIYAARSRGRPVAL